MTIAGKMPEIAGNEKNGEKIHHPPRVCLETTNVLETWQDSSIFHTSQSGLGVLIPTII